MTTSANVKPPTPPGLRGQKFRTLRRMMTDANGFFAALLAEYGDIAWYEIPGRDYCAIFSGELLRDLTDNSSVFPPQYPRSRWDVVKSEGLARMRGERHRRLSALTGQAFGPDRMRNYAGMLARQVEAHFETLEPGEGIDIRSVFERLAWTTTFSAVFGEDMRASVEGARTMSRAIKIGYLISALPLGVRIARLPLPYMLKARRAAKEMDTLAYEAIRRAREDPGYSGHDVASFFATARERGLVDWSFENDMAIRDEGFSLVWISYETSIIPLVYSVWYLAQNPAVRERLEREVDETIGDRPLRADDADKLPYTKAVIKELLRVQSPAQTLVPRLALEDTVLGGYSIPRGTIIQTPLMVIHTRADYWERTGEFVPERWLSDSPRGASACPAHAFAPFSRGDRPCRGAPLAMVLMTFALACVARRFRVEPLDKPVPARTSPDVGFFSGPQLATVTARPKTV